MMTDAERLIYGAIEGYIDRHGYSPSIRDLVRLRDYRSTSAVWYHLDRMRAKGVLTFTDGIARSIVLLGEDVPA